VNRKTFDILVPILFALALVIALVIGDEGGVGGVAVIGAVCMAAYYAAIRQNIRKTGPGA
jgi:hypothetical protein